MRTDLLRPTLVDGPSTRSLPSSAQLPENIVVHITMRASLLAVIAILLHATQFAICHAPLSNSHGDPLPHGKPKINRLANRKVYEAQSAELTTMGYFDALEGQYGTSDTPKIFGMMRMTLLTPVTLVTVVATETLLDIMVHYDNSTLPRPTRAVCLGLGTFSTGPRTEPYDPQRTGARLATFLHLLDIFDINATAATCHDPRFSARDKAFLRSFNLSLPVSPEEAKADLVSDEATLFFCPYLNYDVYEQIFKQNWSAARLKNIIIVGSALDGWLDDE